MSKHAFGKYVREVQGMLGISRRHAHRLVTNGFVGRHAVERVLRNGRFLGPWRAAQVAATLQGQEELNVPEGPLIRLVQSDLELLVARPGPVTRKRSVGSGSVLSNDDFDYYWSHGEGGESTSVQQAESDWEKMCGYSGDEVHGHAEVIRKDVWVCESGPSGEDGSWCRLVAEESTIEAYLHFLEPEFKGASILYRFRPDGSVEKALASVKAPKKSSDEEAMIRYLVPDPVDFPDFEPDADLVGVRYLEDEMFDGCNVLDSPVDLEHLCALVPQLPGHAMRVESVADDPNFDPSAEYLTFEAGEPVNHAYVVYSWGVRTNDGILTIDGLIWDPEQGAAQIAARSLADDREGQRWVASEQSGKANVDPGETQAWIAWATRQLDGVQDDSSVVPPRNPYRQSAAHDRHAS